MTDDVNMFLLALINQAIIYEKIANYENSLYIYNQIQENYGD